MPSLKQIRTKITSVKGTRRIMSAMKLISAVKLQRVQSNLLSSRPYSDSLKEVAENVALRCDASKHPLLRVPEETKKIQIVFLTSDRGLCGGFNNNLIRKIETYLVTEAKIYEDVSFRFVGRRGRDHFARTEINTVDSIIGLTERNYTEISKGLAQDIRKDFESGKVDEVIMVYNYFKSAITQIITFEPILPIRPSKKQSDEDKIEETTVEGDYLYEPTRKALLDYLLPKYLEARVERAFMETLTSEHAARMAAMDSATRNADSVVKQLTQLFNKTRQAYITSELMDIVNGTESLSKGGAE